MSARTTDPATFHPQFAYALGRPNDPDATWKCWEDMSAEDLRAAARGLSRSDSDLAGALRHFADRLDSEGLDVWGDLDRRGGSTERGPS